MHRWRNGGVRRTNRCAKAHWMGTSTPSVGRWRSGCTLPSGAGAQTASDHGAALCHCHTRACDGEPACSHSSCGLCMHYTGALIHWTDCKFGEQHAHFAHRPVCFCSLALEARRSSSNQVRCVYPACSAACVQLHPARHVSSQRTASKQHVVIDERVITLHRISSCKRQLRQPSICSS